MDNLNKNLMDIVKVSCGINLIYLIISFFYISKGLIISLIVINLVLIGSYFILIKYGDLFSTMSQSNKVARKLNDYLVKFE